MDVDEPRSKIRGKVLLYTTREPDAEPAMAMVQEIGNELPVVLERLAGRYSPIRSKFPFFSFFWLISNIFFRV
jgi:hypothetical protein